MTPKRNTVIDPMAEGHPEAFVEPRTIPGGWDVSAFFEPEQRYQYQPDMYGHTSVKAASPYDYSQDSL